MKLDEAIKHCEEKAKELSGKGCNECARDHEQLAEWLKELKDLKEQKMSGSKWNYIKTRPLTEEEKEELGAEGFEYMYDCQMPDHGEQLLILTKWGIELDVADNDYGCGLEERGDYDGVIAWLSVKDIMPDTEEERE